MIIPLATCLWATTGDAQVLYHLRPDLVPGLIPSVRANSNPAKGAEAVVTLRPGAHFVIMQVSFVVAAHGGMCM